MNKKTIFILLGGLAIALLAALFFLLNTPEREKVALGPEESPAPAFEELPDPAADLETAEQIERLWPDLKQKEPDEMEVRRNWQEFSKRFPDNLYLPDEYLPAGTEEDVKRTRKQVRAYMKVVGQMKNARRQFSDLQPGQNPPETQAGYSPEEQKLYFEYRLKELRSKIELVEFSREKGALSAYELKEANQRVAEWRKEIQELEGKPGEIQKALEQAEEG